MALAPDTNGTESSSLVITCKGNINDSDLTEKLQKIRLQLTELSESDDDSLSISKIEPWNSVRVTFNIPPESAQRLQQLAQTDSQVLQNLGILSVKIENNDQVNIPPPQLPSSISHAQPLTSVGLGKSVMSSAPSTSSQIRMTVANQQQQQMNTMNFGAMRPNFPWGQVQVPRMQGNLPVGMQGNITQGNVPAGMQPGIQPGVQFNVQQGIQQNMQGQGMHGNIQAGGNIQPGMSSPNMQGGIPSSIQTTMQSGRQSAMQTNIQTSVQQGMHPNMQGGPMPLGLQAAMQPGMQGNMPPGLQGNMPPGMQMNMQPGMQQGIQGGIPPGMQGNMPPGLQGNMQPGIQGGMQPGIQGGMQPGIQGGMQPGIQGGMQPGIQGGMQPGIQGGMQPGIQGGMQPGIQGGMQPNIHAMQQGMNPNVPPFNQMPQFFYPGEIQRFGLNMSPPSDIRPKKKRRSRPKAKKKGSEKDKDETETTDVQPKDTDISKSDMKSIATPPINQMIPATNSGHSVANQNQPVATSTQFADPTQPTTTSNLAVKKPDVSITSPLLVNLLQREIPGTQFPFSNRGGIPTSLASTLQHAAILNSKKMNNMPQSTLSQGLPPMPPASEITRMLPESIGLPPLPTSQVVSSIPSHMSSPQSNVLMTPAVRSQTPNRQQNVSQPVATQHFQQPSDENRINQPAGDGTHNVFSAQQNIPASNAAGVMSLQQPSSVLQPGLGASYGQIEQCRRMPTPLSNNMSPPVRLSGMQSPGPNKLQFSAPGMTNANIPHGLPTSLQQSQVPTSAGPTAVYQQGLNPMMQQGQRQFLTPATQIRNQLPFPLQLQQQQQQTQLNQYFPSNITPSQTPSNQGIDFAHGANFNPGNMFPQRQQAPGNLPFNMVNIPTSNLAQFRMPLPADVSHPGNKGMMPGTSGNMMQNPPVGMMPGKSPVRYRGNQQIPHATHLPPTNIMFPSIPRFPAKPQNNMVMPFDETTLDGISDAEKDLLAMAEKVANEAGMETSNRMANLFSKDNKQTEVVSNEMLLKKDPTQLKEMDSIKVPLGESVKSGDVKQQKSPVIQLTKHDMFMAGDTQNIASWSSTILPIHGKDRYSIHTPTTTGNGDKKLNLKGDKNSQFKTQVLPEGGPSSNSLNSHQPSSFSLPVEAASKAGSSQGTVGSDMPPFETGAHYVSMPSTEGPCQNTNFISQYNTAGAVTDKKLNNPPVSVDELHRKNIFGMNVNTPTQINQGVVQEQKVSDKSSILMQMIHMDSMRNNSGMINLTRSVSEPVGSHGVPLENISADSIKMPTLERMTHDNENSSLPQQQEISKDVAELNAEYVPKTTVSSASQPLMPQLVPKQPPQQQKMYSPKSLLLPSCMPPPGHGSTGNLTNSETQKSSKFDKRARSVSPVTQQGSEFPRLPLTSASFIKQTPSPTTSSPSGMGMSASALLSSIAKSAYNAGMTPRMQSPSENRPPTSQPIVIPAAATTGTPSPTNLPLYANPLGPDAHTKPITVKVSPVTAPEVVKSTPLLPSVLPNVSLASTESNVSPTGDEKPNLTEPSEVEQTPQTPQTTEVPSVPMEETTPEQIDPPKLSVLVEQPTQNKESERSTSTVEHSIGEDAVREQLTVKEEMSEPDLTQNLSSSVQLKRKYDDNPLCDPPPKVLKIDSETKQEDLKKSANADLTDSDDHRPLPLLVRESTIEVGKILSEKGQTAGDMSLESEESSVATMPTLLPSKVELMDIAKCKDTHQFPFKLESEAQTAGEGASISEPITNPAPPKDLTPQNSEVKPTNMKETTEAKQESAHIVKKIEIPTVNTSKSPPDTSPASSKDSTKSSPVERRTTPKRRAAEEASRPLSERSTPSRQCTLQVDEPPATRARRATRNKSPADHPARLREREDSGSSRDQHVEQGADTDGRMTRKRSTRIIGKGSKDTKDK